MGWTLPYTWISAVLSSAKMNEQVRDNLAFLKANIALEAPVELTIATGVVTKTKSYHAIDTQGDDPTDDLDTINGGSDGDIIYLTLENTAREVVLKDGTGNLQIEGDIHIDKTGIVVPLIYDGSLTKWLAFANFREQHTFVVNAGQYPAPGTDWTSSLLGATLAQNKAAKAFWIPLNFLKIGDNLLSYKLIGDAVEGNALTLDCKLVRVNKADPLTSTDIPGGAIAQITVDGNFDVEAVLTNEEDIATDKQYVLEILGTTTSGDSLTVMGVEIVILRH